MKRLAVTAKLKPDSGDRALEVIKRGPPFDPAATGFDRHAVYLGNDEVVFVFEAENVESVVQTVVDDPAISAAFSAWGPLLEGTPSLARPVYHWEKTNGSGVLQWDEGWAE
jgi:hypothetical protein